MAKVAASISDQLDYAQSIINSEADLEVSVDTAENLFGYLTNIATWNEPLYDDEKSSYNLSFKAPADKDAETLAGTFSINHKVTGFNDENFPDNGKTTDTISASYGKDDNLTLSKSFSYNEKTKGEATISSTVSSFKETVKSSNDTFDDKADDYSRTINYSSSYSESDIDGLILNNYKLGDAYNSKFMNYKIDESSTTDTKKSTYSFKGSYSSDDGEGLTAKADVAYSSNERNSDGSSSDDGSFDTHKLDITNFSWNVVDKNDPENNVSVSFSGGLAGDDSGETLKLDKFSFSDSSMDVTSIGGLSVTSDDVDLSSFHDNFSELTTVFGQDDSALSDVAKQLGDFFSAELSAAASKITIKTADGVEINAGGGNDEVTGGAGDDSITGGTGSDKLTGGDGADTFSFTQDDFFGENDNGGLVFNKSLDTITDYSLKDGDTLDLDGGDVSAFFKTLKDAKSEQAEGFFAVAQDSKIYFGTVNPDTEKYTATPVIVLVGKGLFAADGSGWAEVA